MQIQSVQRAFDILQLLDETAVPTSASAIAEQVDLPRTTVVRMLATLEKVGAVQRVDESSQYQIGPKLRMMGQPKTSQKKLKEIAQQHLKQLAANSGETVYLCTPAGNQRKELMQASHISRKSNAPANIIQSITPNGRTLQIGWKDGHESTFHHIWLRDNCSCDQCGDHSGGSRFFELGDIADDLGCETAVSDNMLTLTWASDGHVTQYDTSWLRAHCNSDSERIKRRHNPILWDAALTGNVPEADYMIAQESDTERLKIHDAVRTYGICLLRNVPATVEATEEVAGLLGFVRRTHYGRIFEIISTPNPTIIANAPVPLRPHTDENFREPPPGIMIFHTIRASEDGGGVSVMTDAFQLAADYKEINPEGYELLSTVPIPHRRFIKGVGLRAESPMIQHDFFGNISEFRMNERTMGPIDLPPHLIEPIYKALNGILELSYQSKYHMHHLLDSGEALAFDNARVMHARTGFNGNRHVRLTHIGSDEFYSRWRQLRNKLHGDINLI